MLLSIHKINSSWMERCISEECEKSGERIRDVEVRDEGRVECAQTVKGGLERGFVCVCVR